ncbi:MULTISPECIES: SusC/RagA family TonB-linked outer membrane protein [unclassified Chryseobacterium]|uniref:SusC/RagA family TonB-linked outer membrane protein n=1 Tax=unclassified Chryseobacterium TaxID=2593645 RepID=UPI0009F3F8F0|nr:MULTISPECIES: TonB-dependent receptor [unclassified Chryseobacterium]
MNSKHLRITVVIAALYFSGDLYGQEKDTLNEKKIEEVVVIGYGKAKAKDLTGSVSVINMNKTSNQPVADVGQAIQGRASGVTVINSGEPGSNVTFRIRGTGTIKNNDPLIVVDGMPLNGGLNQINMSDVESINILKDASSTAIYGSRGANGVVIITTKRGAKGGVLNFDTFTAIQSTANMPKVLNASQYAQLNNEMLSNAGLATNPEFSDPSSLGAGTDWLKALFSPSLMSNYSLSYGDRSEKSNLYVSASYFNQKGMVLNTDYERFIVQLNSDTKVKPFLKLGNSLKVQHDVKKKGEYDVKNTILSLPTRAIYDQNGNWSGPGNNPMLYGDIDNPIGKASLVDKSTKGYNVQGNIYGEVDILKDFKFKSLGGVEVNIWDDRTWSPRYQWGVKSQENSYLYEGNNKSITLLWDNTLTYDKTFGNHHLNVVAGSSSQSNQYKYLNASVQKFASDNTQQIDNGTLQPTQHGNMSEWAIMSYLGRANYSFADKYYLTATIRRDGSSRFGRSNRWGWFPSAAFAWRISNENFLKDSKTINNLKLRLGYGITGNQEIGNYSFSSSYNTYRYNFNNTYVGAVLPTMLPNPNVKWEGQEQFNAGIDLDMFNNRISLIVDGYIKNTNDMLVPLSVPVTSGYSDIYVPYTNAGKIQNKGIEVTLSTKNLLKTDFKWSTDAVFSYNKNIVETINSDTPILVSNTGFNSTIGLIQAGYPVNVFYGYVTDGIFQNEADINAHAVQTPGSNSATSTAPGDIRFKDLNNDGVINDKDRTYIGNPNPKFTFSLNNTFSYENFDLTIFLQGAYGNDIYNANRMYTESMSVIQNQSTSVLGRWNGEGSSNSMPRAIFGDPNQNSRVSDRYIEDGSYIKLKNINLSYTLPKGIFGENLKLVKIFVSAQNLLTWTKYSGFDPEVPVNGIDNGTYPISRTVSLGLNVAF